ncbi:thiamine pyrophosphate-binding protein [Microbacterium kribbense]|uniref:Thiamine pyrophosphate-binding protein n=1 Tax=Microbacterium kribbense TaxID=433645 RepID=A0ABP7GTX7_9MICO
MEKVTVAVAVGRAMAAAGAAHAFGVVGSGNFHMTNALINAGVEFTQTRHELGAALAADAYSRLTGRVAVVSVHQGGGYLNSLTGVLEAVKAHTGVVVVAGEVARGDLVSNFYLDQSQAAVAVGAVAIRVHVARDAIKDAAAAVHTAVARRMPVILSVPIDIQEELVEWDPALVPAAPEAAQAVPDATSIAKIVDLLVRADRPVIVGGRGAHHAKAALRELGAAAGALLVASGGGRGIFVGDEWALDVMGGFATDGAAALIKDADLLVVFGVALTKWTARGGELTDGQTIVQVDDRPEAFGLHRSVTLGVLGDSAPVAQMVTAAIRDRFPDGRAAYRTPEVHARVQAVRYWSDQNIEFIRTNGFIDPAELSIDLDRRLPLERVVIPDGGNVNAYGGSFLRVPDENGYVLSIASQSIGSGLAEGIGAAMARPDRLTVVATGDGSLLMNAVELDTAVRTHLGMLIVVFNDSAYGAEAHIFDSDPQKDAVRFPETDIAAIARGYGCEATTVRSLDDLAPLDAWLAGPRDHPFLIDAKIEGFASPLMAQKLH